ncbi:hypothetical protein FXW07_07805 [Methanosarcina sp. DH1]|uniref:hypothetical protein n=1 Tax=Methanosarcina sp. DH1 TaxID=2605695 RepID=UPI001E52B1E9|nr:hypothetical protein [Methanosarcina sp. DH1]MCC4766522.1 hypothetical protein [Methanosarcina sp. DH1]
MAIRKLRIIVSDFILDQLYNYTLEYKYVYFSRVLCGFVWESETFHEQQKVKLYFGHAQCMAGTRCKL